MSQYRPAASFDPRFQGSGRPKIADLLNFPASRPSVSYFGSYNQLRAGENELIQPDRQRSLGGMFPAVQAHQWVRRSGRHTTDPASSTSPAFRTAPAGWDSEIPLNKRLRTTFLTSRTVATAPYWLADSLTSRARVTGMPVG